MITMKKFFWVTIITLSMSLTLSGCGSSSNGKSQTTSATKVPANNQNTSKSEPTKVDNSTPNPTKEVAVTTEPTVEDIDPVAQNLIDLIKTIGTVELDDEALISKINTRYSQMTEKQKNQVYNYIDVINAEDELELLKSNGLESMINNIKGVYKQTNYENNENYYSVAYITDNEIKVYWAYNNGKILSLYWTGTFEKPNNVLDNYT